MRYHTLFSRPVWAGGLIIVSITVFCYHYGFSLEHFRPEAISRAIIALGPWGPVIYILLNILRPLIFFPAILLAVAGGLAYGPFFGALYLIIGTVLGAAGCFWLARLLGRGKAGRRLPDCIPFDKLSRQLDDAQGFKTLLLFRLAPVVPWDAVSFISGLTKIGFWPYCLATFLGSIPGALAFCYLGNALHHSVLTAVWGAIIVAVIVSCIPQALWRNMEREQRNS